MKETGVIHGRFQPLHLKHMEYVLAAKMRCRLLYIGIIHPDLTSYPAVSPLDLHGREKKDNPLTFMERYEMLKEALLDFGVKRDEFEIIPFPVSRPELLSQYMPEKAVYYMSICSEWDEERSRMLTELGADVEILWRRNSEEKGITGTKLREMIAREGEWEKYMPKTAIQYLKEHDIIQRIRQLYFTGKE